MSDVHQLDEPADVPPAADSTAHADAARAEPRHPGLLEMVITVALGLAAIVGAYAAYRNEQSNHHATVHFSEGITNFDDAGQLFATANSTLNRDQAQFIARSQFDMRRVGVEMHLSKGDAPRFAKSQAGICKCAPE